MLHGRAHKSEIADNGADYAAALKVLLTAEKLRDDVRDEQIPVVFYIEFSTEKIADTICDATGAEKLLMHSGHTVTQEELNDGITYVDLMQ